jgi:hypothetical protein
MAKRIFGSNTGNYVYIKNYPGAIGKILGWDPARSVYQNAQYVVKFKYKGNEMRMIFEWGGISDKPFSKKSQKVEKRENDFIEEFYSK